MSDTEARDQLVEDLLGVLCNLANFPRSAVGLLGQDMRPLAGKVADSILEAGWRPPARVVTTVEELDAQTAETFAGQDIDGVFDPVSAVKLDPRIRLLAASR